MPRRLNPKSEMHAKRVTAHIHIKMIEALQKESKRTNQNISQIIRRALDKYFDTEAQQEDTDFFTNTIRPVVKDEIGKQANRLIDAVQDWNHHRRWLLYDTQSFI